MKNVDLVDLGSQVIELHNEKIYCVADLHLCASRPQEIVSFANEIIGTCNKYSVVLILGDLFDVYVGPESLCGVDFAPLLSAFEQFAATGRVIVIRGNRDVLLEGTHAEKHSFEVCDVVLSNCEQRRTLYVHGDAFCTSDLPYQRLRRVLRNRVLRLFLRMLPAVLRRYLGDKMRKTSTSEIARKEMIDMQLNLSAVAASAKQFESSVVRIGHLHQAQQQQIDSSCSLEVLSAWQPLLTRG